MLFLVIDDCLELLDRHALARPHPPDDGQGLPVRGPGLAQYADECVVEPAVFDLRRKVAIEEDAAVPFETAFSRSKRPDGRRFETRLTEAGRTTARPMSDTELEAKFRSLIYGSELSRIG